MIDDKANIEEFNLIYNNIPIRKKTNFICDYCNSKFKRIKKSRERLNKIILKDSCGEKICKNKKKRRSKFKITWCKKLLSI